MVRSLFLCILLLSGCGPSSGGHNKSPAQGNPAPNLQRFSDLVHLKGSLTYKAHIKTTVHLTQTTAADGPKKGYTLPKKRLSMEEDLTLTMDPRGNIHGRRDLSSGDGVEFTVQGQQMCVRLRYQKYLCHPYVPEEAQSRVKQIYGTFSGIMGLIAPFTLISDPKPCPDASGGCLRRTLGVNPTPHGRGDLLDSPTLVSITGSFDKDTNGIPLGAVIAFTLKGKRKDQREVEVTMEYTHTLTSHKGPVPVADPPMIEKDWERHRHLMDRKALLGDPIPRSLRYLFRQ